MKISTLPCIAKFAFLAALLLASKIALAQTICTTSDSDPDGDGWGWENNKSCVVADTSYEFRFYNVGKPAGSDWARTIIAASEEFVFAQSGAQVHVIKRVSERDFDNHQVIDLDDSGMGCTADIDGNVAVIGSCTGSTQATIYRLQSSGLWQAEAVLDAPVAVQSGRHATSVAIKGQVVAISSPYFNPGFPQGYNGAVHLYRHFDGGNWVVENEILGAQNKISYFGQSIALADENTLVVGRGLSRSTVTCAPESSASGCTPLYIVNELTERGGVGIYSYSANGSWDYLPQALPITASNTEESLGMAVAANENTIVFSGVEKNAEWLHTIHVMQKQDDNSWLATQRLLPESPVASRRFTTPTLKLSADGQNLTHSPYSGTSLESFSYTPFAGFKPAGSIDRINEKHDVINDRIITVRTGHVVIFRRTVDLPGTPDPMPISLCDYRNAALHDGWGWNATLQVSCPPVATTCADSDGDGWGWDGTKSCRVDGADASDQIEVPLCEQSQSDSNGDGWGWENNTSCIVED